MAFNQQEQNIIKYGLENGKSKEEVTKAITNFRLGITTTTKINQPSTLERVVSGIQEKGAKITDIITDDLKSSLARGVEATATGFSALSSTAYNALPDDARNLLDKVAGGIGKGFGFLTDKISNSKFLQEAIMSGQTGKLEETIKIASDLGLISGEILGVKATASATKFIDKGITGTIDIIKKMPKIKDLIKTPTSLTQYPKQIADAISSKITKIDPKVRNILEDTTIEKFDRYVKAGEASLKNSRLLTPLEQAGELVDNKILPAIKEDLGRIGAQKAKTLASISTQKAPNIATDAIDYIRSKTQSIKMTIDERKLVNALENELKKLGKIPTIGSADKTVDLLQATLFEKAGNLSIPVTTRVKSLVNQTIGKLNNSVKTIAEKKLGSTEYSVLNNAYAEKIQLFNKLNKAIGAEGMRGGSLFKKFFSPQDAGTKKLFADIKENYGVDLAQDAVLAKFVMESLGDTRAAFLLQMVPLTTAGAIVKGVKFLEGKLTNPIPKAREIIKSAPKNIL